MIEGDDIGQIEFFIDGTYRVNDEIPVSALMQFTGLKDKNGKEIYEGDIIRWFNTYNEARTEKVEWHENYHGYAFPHILPAPGLVEMEVIGNIYENPELLAPPHTN